jgi:hypothetical protein
MFNQKWYGQGQPYDTTVVFAQMKSEKGRNVIEFLMSSGTVKVQRYSLTVTTT